VISHGEPGLCVAGQAAETRRDSGIVSPAYGQAMHVHESYRNLLENANPVRLSLAPCLRSVYETLTCMPEALPYAAAAWVSVAASRIGRIAKAWMDETTPENGIRWAACNDRL